MSDWKHLLKRYVATFERLDDMSADELLNPIGWMLAVGESDPYGFKQWQATEISTPDSCLQKLYAKLPGPFPPLFERLVLSYRWAEVDLHSYRLLANPPGQGLDGLLDQMSRDSGLWDALLPAGYLQFGRGPDIDYDPVCFDLGSKNKVGDCRIVKIDHEEILCNYRVKVISELAPSFEDLVLQTIELGERV
jgi:hypothetical protein